ncbi:von Willebrand factor-like [Saccoglossus kowalevskii]|uniref:Otogelin-like protein-like n=1 Tax=Saccoglossus kowalevskii TaxID=10224 RepID=A0ABM0MKI7_SACKO|nr:PREDICTED: otogelin-like protein-like [Saccoglossus kowalevskii]
MERDNKIVLNKAGEFSLSWDGIGRVNIKLDDTYKGHVCGLLGNADDNPDDDLMELTADGLKLTTNTDEFAKSWEIPDSCPSK